LPEVSGTGNAQRYFASFSAGPWYHSTNNHRRIAMKEYFSLLMAATVVCVLSSVEAQPGPRGVMGGPPGPKFNASMTKLFGEHAGFSAGMEIQTKEMSLPGKIEFIDGKSRFEMDMTKASGPSVRPGMGEQMKMMGMDKVVTISRPDKKLTYLVHPGLESYVETPIKDSGAEGAADKSKIETTELGKETVDGHPCVKNKVIVTDDKGASNEFTVWNATDLKKFPVKIIQTQDGADVTMLFKEVKLGKPGNVELDPPAAYQRYTDQMTMMREQMMKRMSGAGGFTPPPR
jgi:hypothetical protein